MMRVGKGWIRECLRQLITKKVFPEREGPAITSEVGCENEKWHEFILISRKKKLHEKKNFEDFYTKSNAISS